MKQFKRWAEEDFEQYKRREAAYNEEMDRRIAEAWPKIKPWVSWAVPKELHAKQSTNQSATTSPTGESQKYQHAKDAASDTGVSGNPSLRPDLERPQVHAANPMESPGTLSEYDPITMRRVVRSTSSPPTQKVEAGKSEKAFEIAVKPFVPPGVRPPKVKPQESVLHGNSTLSERSKHHPKQDTAAESRLQEKPRIENALDRHIRNKDQSGDTKYPQNPEKKDVKNRSTREDLETLRASDIRSSPTLNKRPRAETSKNDGVSSSDLDKRYRKHLQRIEALAADVHNPRRRRRSLHQISSVAPISSDTQATETLDTAQSPSSSCVTTNDPQIQQAQQTLSEARQRKNEAIREAHAAEVNAHKATMDELESRPRTVSAFPVGSSTSNIVPGEGDMATNVHEFAGRNRWYKQRSRSSPIESLGNMEQFKRDQGLVKEIRNIYEDAYGTIDTEHRQLSLETTRAAQNSQTISDPEIWTSGDPPSKTNGIPQAAKAISSRLLRSMNEIQSMVTGLYGKMPAAVKSSTTMQDSLQQSVEDKSYDTGSDTTSTASPHEDSDEAPLPEGHTVYKILSVPSPEGDGNLHVATITGPAERPNSPPATIPEIAAHLHQPIKPFVNEMEKLMRHGYEPTSRLTRRDYIILRKIQPLARDIGGLYKILSFDPATERMSITVAKGQGERCTKKDLTIPAMLDQINHPDRFIPFLTDLGKEGWRPAGRNIWTSYKNNKDLLCFWRPGEPPEGTKEGTSSVLVAKHVEPSGAQLVRDDHQDASSEAVVPEKGSETVPANLWPNPVDGTLSPTGFVNYESLRSSPSEPESTTQTSKSDDSSPTYPIPPVNSSPPPSLSSPTKKKVRREEPVFSGTYHSPPSSHSHHSRNKHWQPSVMKYGMPLFSKSRRAAKRVRMIQKQQQQQQQQQLEYGRVKRVFKRMMKGGLAFAGAFYAVGLGISSLFWISAVALPIFEYYFE